jgi:hypothetical protein
LADAGGGSFGDDYGKSLPRRELHHSPAFGAPVAFGPVANWLILRPNEGLPIAISR